MIPIDIQSLKRLTRNVGIDFFLKRSNHYTHVFERETGLDYQRLAHYLRHGVTQLYIQALDQEKFQQVLATQQAADVFQNLKALPETRVAALHNMTEQNLSELFSCVPVNEEMIRDSRQIVRNTIQLAMEDLGLVSLLLHLTARSDYFYAHSLSVLIFSIILGRHTHEFSPAELEELGLGALLHDIGFAWISMEINLNDTTLTQGQRETIRSHPLLGAQMLNRLEEIPEPVKRIILEHHERLNGQGYPIGLKAHEIFHATKYVSVADCLSTTISRQPHQEAYPLEEAITLIEVEPEKFDKNLTRVLREIFRVRQMKAAG